MEKNLKFQTKNQCSSQKQSWKVNNLYQMWWENKKADGGLSSRVTSVHFSCHHWSSPCLCWLRNWSQVDSSRPDPYSSMLLWAGITSHPEASTKTELVWFWMCFPAKQSKSDEWVNLSSTPSTVSVYLQTSFANWDRAMTDLAEVAFFFPNSWCYIE